MIRETYKGRQLKVVKGKTYGKTRVFVNGTDCGEWFGTQTEQIEWAKRTIDDVDARPFEGRWAECWYAPGTYELNEHGHVIAPGGICSCAYCAERRVQPCADIKVDSQCVCDHCMKPYLQHESGELEMPEGATEEASEEPTPIVDDEDPNLSGVARGLAAPPLMRQAVGGEMARKLPPTQEKALRTIRKDGVLYAYNGVSRTTVAVLERLGLVSVEWTTSTVRGNGYGGVWTSRTQLDWTARPVKDA